MTIIKKILATNGHRKVWAYSRSSRILRVTELWRISEGQKRRRKWSAHQLQTLWKTSTLQCHIALIIKFYCLIYTFVYITISTFTIPHDMKPITLHSKVISPTMPLHLHFTCIQCFSIISSLKNAGRFKHQFKVFLLYCKFGTLAKIYWYLQLYTLYLK